MSEPMTNRNRWLALVIVCRATISTGWASSHGDRGEGTNSTPLGAGGLNGLADEQPEHCDNDDCSHDDHDHDRGQACCDQDHRQCA